MEGGLVTGQRYYPALRAGKGPGTQCTIGWVGHSTGLDRCRESRRHRNFISWPSIPQRVSIL